MLYTRQSYRRSFFGERSAGIEPAPGSWKKMAVAWGIHLFASALVAFWKNEIINFCFFVLAYFRELLPKGIWRKDLLFLNSSGDWDNNWRDFLWSERLKRDNILKLCILKSTGCLHKENEKEQTQTESPL